jgi:hypothetical protein
LYPSSFWGTLFLQSAAQLGKVEISILAFKADQAVYLIMRQAADTQWTDNEVMYGD